MRHFSLRTGLSGLSPLALALLLILGATGCSTDEPKADPPVGEDTDAPLDAADGSVPTDAGPTDVSADSGPGETDVKVEADAADVPKADVPEIVCTSDVYCVSSYGDTLSACETAVCDLQTSLCKKIHKVGTCCEDSDCDDEAACTTDSCNKGTNKCTNALIPNCDCEGKVQILDEGFEQGTLGEFSAKEGAKNGNVKWQIDPKRHHSGTHALYLGNECYTYDNTQTAAGNCAPNLAGGPPVFSTLTTKSLNLPVGKPVIAQFWIWIAAEPKLSEELKDATGKVIKQALPASDKCKPFPCDPGYSCVTLPKPPETCDPACPAGQICQGGQCIPAAQCLPENDVLLVYLDVPGKGSTVVWDSSDLAKKSTDGWQHVVININQSAAGAKSVQVRWEFRTNNGNLNGFEGVWLDDVRVESLCATDTGPFSLCKAADGCPDDNNSCSADICTPYAAAKQASSAGLCLYDMSPGCCVKDIDCNDKQDCTIDTCTLAADAKPGEAGTCNNAPDASNPVCCQPVDLFADKFNQTMSGWTPTGQSKTVTWHHTTKDNASGEGGAICFGNSNCDSYDDKTLKKVSSLLCSKEFTIKAGTHYDKLSFKLKLKTEWSGQDAAKYKNPPCPSKDSCLDYKLDHLSAKLKIGGLFEQIWSSDSIAGTTEDKWKAIKLSLDPWKGKKASLCFEFDTGDSYANDKGAVFIDDVLLEVTCKDDVCTPETVVEDCAGKAGACESVACVASQCVVTKEAGCCVADADCDDGDACSTGKCNAGKCEQTPDADPKCCKTDKVGDLAVFSQDFEADTGGATLPAGWKAKCLGGKPELDGQKYTCDIKWYVTTVKAKPDPDSPTPKVKSLHFGKAGGLINVPNFAPAGAVESPEITVPANGTTLLSFDLLLKTEWDPPIGNWSDPPPPFPIDQFQVHLVDVEAQQADPLKGIAKIWDSYEIKGVTGGQWKAVLVKVPADYAGKLVRLRLVFDAGTSTKNQVEGAFVDNVSVETLCTTPACVADKECPAGGVTPDKCQSYFCGKDDKGVYGCQSAAKNPAPQGCCAKELLLPLETVEGGSGKIAKWTGDDEPGDLVKWQVIPHKYMIDKWEIYFGDPKTWSYATGSKKSCAEDKDCESGESCTGAVGKKTCLAQVSGKLTSATIDLSSNLKEGVEFGFHIWADIEPQFETLEVWVLEATGVPIEKVWDHQSAGVAKTFTLKQLSQQKIDLAKYKSKTQIKIEFRFDSLDGAKNDAFGGIHLDNLYVEKTCL